MIDMRLLAARKLAHALLGLDGQLDDASAGRIDDGDPVGFARSVGSNLTTCAELARAAPDVPEVRECRLVLELLTHDLADFWVLVQASAFHGHALEKLTAQIAHFCGRAWRNNSEQSRRAAAALMVFTDDALHERPAPLTGDTPAAETVRPPLPPLNDTDESAAAFIRKFPGMTSEKIAEGCDRLFTAEHFRGRIWPKLLERGFRNGTNGRGYWPPNS